MYFSRVFAEVKHILNSLHKSRVSLVSLQLPYDYRVFCEQASLENKVFQFVCTGLPKMELSLTTKKR